MKLSIGHPSPSHRKWIGALKPPPYIISYQRPPSLAHIQYSLLHRLWCQHCCFLHYIVLCKINCSCKWKQLWQQCIFTSLNHWRIIWIILISCWREWERHLHYFYEYQLWLWSIFHWSYAAWLGDKTTFREYLKETNSGEENKLLDRLWRNLVETIENLETLPVFPIPGY